MRVDNQIFLGLGTQLKLLIGLGQVNIRKDFTLLCTVKAWVHLNWSEGHILGYGGYLEQAMSF